MMAKVPRETVNYYCGFYPEIKCKQVEKVLNAVKQARGYLDAITVQHYMGMKYGDRLMRVM
jgi:hypothetical protein